MTRSILKRIVYEWFDDIKIANVSESMNPLRDGILVEIKSTTNVNCIDGFPSISTTNDRFIRDVSYTWMFRDLHNDEQR